MVRPYLKRGRPVNKAPLDQRVTVTVTTRERITAEMEAKKLKGTESLAELVRNRVDASIDLNAWKNAAVESLSKIRESDAEKRRLRSNIEKTNRARERAMITGDVERVEALDLEKRTLTEAYVALGKEGEKRTARLIGRVSLADKERIIWRASKLGLTVSDFVRIMVFDQLPGESDQHMSNMSRKRFYESVIKVANEGWGEAPKVTSNQCPHCHKPLR